jgi:hypothetical protein
MADNAKTSIGQSKLDLGSRRVGASIATNIPPLGKA